MKQEELKAQPVKALVEYSVAGEPWRCNHFDLLSVEFEGITVEGLERLQSLALATGRGWMILRRLYGMTPVVPPPSTEPGDLRSWEREELRKALGLTRAQMASELDALRGAWSKGADLKAKIESPEQRLAAPAPAKPDGEFRFEEGELLERYGFRMKFDSMAEKAWFAERVKAFQSMLRESFSTALARNTLISELRVRQMDDVLNGMNPNTADYVRVYKMRNEVEEIHRKQVAQLKELCPWAGTMAGKHSFQGVMSDLTLAYQEYVARGDTKLIDGMFTLTEIAVECRRSTQVPDPRYRQGLVVFVNAARAGLWDPNWKPPESLSPGVLKKLDAAGKAAMIAAGAEEPLVDLEAEGAAGEFPDIGKPKT